MQEADDSDAEDDDDESDNITGVKEMILNTPKVDICREQKTEARWVGEPVFTDDQCNYYR